MEKYIYLNGEKKWSGIKQWSSFLMLFEDAWLLTFCDQNFTYPALVQIYLRENQNSQSIFTMM